MNGKDRFLDGNRLRLHLLEWGEGERVVLLLHGFLEHAHGWDFVAPLLAARGLHVYALDFRGHGESQWVGAGGYYHFLDYVADLSFVVPQLAESVAIVGHSMGGGAAILYAGTEPQRVTALISIEGLGVPDCDPTQVPERVNDWISDLHRVGKRRRMVESIDDVASRMCARFPSLPLEAARHLVRHNVSAGQWRFDPLHQTRSPQPTYVAQARAFWQRVDCPVLYVEGSESYLRLPPADLEERLTALRAHRALIDRAGHHPHLEQPEATARVLIDFLSNAD